MDSRPIYDLSEEQERTYWQEFIALIAAHPAFAWASL
jgi:hypothetical protein